MSEFSTFLMIQDYLDACDGVREQDSNWLKWKNNQAIHQRGLTKLKAMRELIKRELEDATIPDDCRRADPSELAHVDERLAHLKSDEMPEDFSLHERARHCAIIYLSTAAIADEVARAGGDPQAVRRLAESLRDGKLWLHRACMDLVSSPEIFPDQHLVQQASDLLELWEVIEPILHSIQEELRQLPRSDKEETEFTQIAEQLAGQKQDLFEMLAAEGGWVEYETLRDSSVFRSSSVTDGSIKRAIDRLKDDLTFLAPAWTVIIRKSKARLERV